jgi:hypothetical protein
MLARVVAAAVVPRSAAVSPGTFVVGWRPPRFGRRHSVRGMGRTASEQLPRRSRTYRRDRNGPRGARCDLDRPFRRAKAHVSQRRSCRRAIQRTGFGNRQARPRRASRNRGQVSRPGGTRRYLLDRHIEPRRGAAWNGVPFQPPPPKCRDISGTMRVHPRWYPADIRTEL